jgi:hypothetical protein
MSWSSFQSFNDEVEEVVARFTPDRLSLFWRELEQELFYANVIVKLGAGTFFLPPPPEPRSFKSHIYTLRLICTCSVAQALSITTFRFRKDVELTKLFKIAYRVVFRGRRTDFRDFKSRSKIACNFTKTKYVENLKVGSDSPWAPHSVHIGNIYRSLN